MLKKIHKWKFHLSIKAKRLAQKHHLDAPGSPSRSSTPASNNVNINLNIIYSPCVLDPSVIMFKNSTQNFNISDALYTIPVIRTQGLENPSTVNWRTNSPRLNMSGLVKFAPGETEKNIVIDTRTQQIPSKPETFQLELYDPSTNSLVRDRKTTLVNITDPRGENFCFYSWAPSHMIIQFWKWVLQFSLMDEINAVCGSALDCLQPDCTHC